MRKRTIEEVKEIVENLGYELINEYTGKRSRRRVVIKDVNGYKYDVYLDKLTRNHIPYFVAISNPFVLENISLWMELNNKTFKLRKNNIYRGATQKLFFSCDDCSEEFNLTWVSIYNHGSGCPVCSGKVVSDKNRLSILYPEIASEWHPTRNGELTPYDASYGMGQKIWWLCEDGHEWKASINNRTHKNQGCPVCSGRIVSDKNRFSILYPELILEWHPTKNGELTPHDISFGISKRVWWLCEEGHEWKASINRRTNPNSNTGCPKCASSKGEKEILSFLKEFNVAHITEYRFENCRHKKELPFDFAIFDSDGYLHCIIEYHGEQHYRPIKFFGGQKKYEERIRNDKIKSDYCRNNNIPLKIIPYWDFDNIESILQDYLLGGV